MRWEPADVDQPDYYWQNFNTILRWVRHHHDTLLDEETRLTLARYELLNTDAQKLWIRLSSRRGQQFRGDALSYSEINLDRALAALEREGWLNVYHKIDSPEGLELLKRAELLQLARENGCTLSASAKKADILEALRACPTPWLVAAQLQWYALTQQANFDRLSLLFFGNAHQDLTEFIKTALGHVRYETYTIRPKSLFNSSEDVANYHAMSAFRQRYSDTEGLTERIRIIRDWYKRAANHQGWKKFRGAYSRLCNKLARDCERADALDDALKIYQQSFRPPARERMARIYRKQGNNKQAYSTLNQMAKDPWNDPEHAIAEQLLSRWFAEPSTTSVEPETHYLSFASRGTSIEAETLTYFEQQGWQGGHHENTIPQTLFGILFWDVIFEDIEGAFVHPFQRGPRDLNSHEFYHRREASIKKRLDEIKHSPDTVTQRITQVIDEKIGLANPFIYWPGVDKSALTNWWLRLQGQQWAAIFERIARDVHNNRAGFPDLWLYRDKQVMLIEVKGPGDTLRPNQIRWLRALNEIGVNANLALVKLG